MRHPFKTACLLALGFVLGGCATPTTQSVALNANLTNDEIRYQQKLSLMRTVEYQQRIDRIGAPLLKAALPFCEHNRTGYLGLKVENLSAWPLELRRLVKANLNLDEALKVTSVTPGSAAERAGIQVGDMVRSLNGHITIGGSGAVEDYRSLLQQSLGAPVKFELVRGGERLNLTVSPEPACNYGLHVLMSNAINAYSDGQNVYINSGLLRFAESDAEVAMVLAHEMAHNGMAHIESKRSNMSTAGILDIALAAAYGIDTGGLFASMGANAFSKEFEQEADYVGLYIMARAGMPLNGVADFWRRMAAESPDANEDSIFRTHPISAQRTLAVEQATQEIETKRVKGVTLLPNE
ncbi:MAG: M48 family metalloprotease [Oceanospirillales bacterium]|nr:M48 family metalloprotease [Oceanospirillales bacterium]